MQNALDGLRYASRDAAFVKQLFCERVCPMDFKLETEYAPWGISFFGGVQLPGLTVLKNEGYGQRQATRTRRHIVENPGGEFIITLPVNVPTFVSQFGVTKRCDPGSFRLLTTTSPFTGFVAAEDGTRKYCELVGIISSARIRQILPCIEDFSNVPIALRPGAGNLLRTLFEVALSDGEALSNEHASALSDAILHAIKFAVIESPQAVEFRDDLRQSSLERVREAALDFVARNLSNPNLDNRLIAAVCKVSERYLQSAFAAVSLRLGTYVREQRLQHCRVALKNPDMAKYSVREIAEQWGFDSPTSFNRLYKSRFGTAPGGDRGTRDHC